MSASPTVPCAWATIAATIRRTIPRRKLGARTSTTIVSCEVETSTRVTAKDPAGGSDVNEAKSCCPGKRAPASRSAATDRSPYRWYRYQRSWAWRGWNVAGTSVYAHAQRSLALSLNAPTIASGRRFPLNAITFPIALTPRSVRLALRKNDSRGSRRIFADRSAARHSPSTVRRSGCRWWPKKRCPPIAILSATRMPRHIFVTVYRARRADGSRRPRRAEEPGERRRGRRAMKNFGVGELVLVNPCPV